MQGEERESATIPIAAPDAFKKRRFVKDIVAMACRTRIRANAAPKTLSGDIFPNRVFKDLGVCFGECRQFLGPFHFRDGFISHLLFCQSLHISEENRKLVHQLLSLFGQSLNEELVADRGEQNVASLL